MARQKKPSRRLKNTGTVFWSPSRNRYVGRVIIGRYPSGKPKYQQVTADSTQGLRAAMECVEPPKEGVTVAAWLDRWLAEMKCKPGTRRSRVAAVTHHLKPALGHLKVSELTPRQVEVAASSWPLKGTSARNVAAILGTALRAAVRHNLRVDNPVRAAHKPKAERKKIDPYTVEELATISRAAAQKPNTRAIAVLAATGMRVGELLALDVQDVDTSAWTVSITKTLDCADRDLRGTPKSPNSVRVIEVPEKPPEAREAIRAAIGNRTSGPLFLTGKGRRVIYKVLSKANETLLKRLGLRYRGVHQLRHSWASHALAAGVDVAEVAAYLGDTPKMILDTYAKPTGRVNAAKAFAGLFRAQRTDNSVTPESPKRAAPRKSQAKRRK
jgi:integrase